MNFVEFLSEFLGITDDFNISSIDRDENEKVIEIHLKHNKSTFTKDGKTYKLYDKIPKRKWQNLSWFDLKSPRTGERIEIREGRFDTLFTM